MSVSRQLARIFGSKAAAALDVEFGSSGAIGAGLMTPDATKGFGPGLAGENNNGATLDHTFGQVFVPFDTLYQLDVTGSTTSDVDDDYMTWVSGNPGTITIKKAGWYFLKWEVDFDAAAGPISLGLGGVPGGREHLPVPAGLTVAAGSAFGYLPVGSQISVTANLGALSADLVVEYAYLVAVPASFT